ncbi:MAG: type IV secretion system DNA-binding domain-containing protein [Candidatus Saccharimonadales bacterium]
MIWLRGHQNPASSYELTPPLQGVPGMDRTTQLFAYLSSVAWQRNPLTRGLYGSHAVSLEIVGSKSRGIRYVLQVPGAVEQAVLAALASHTPSVKAQKIAPRTNLTGPADIREFKQTGHFGYPLKRFDMLDLNDPMVYITAAMTKLEPGEEMALQFVITPVRLKAARQLSAQLLKNAVLGTQLKRQTVPVVRGALNGLNKLMFGVLDMISQVQSNGSSRSSSGQSSLAEQQRVFEHKKPVRSLSLFEQELLTSVHDKLAEPHFQVSVRSRVVSLNSKITKQRQEQVRAALAAYSTGKYQVIQPKRQLIRLQRHHLARRYEGRLPNKRISSSLILSASELASLYHFPNYLAHQTENVVKSLSKSLPAPISLKTGKKLSILIGDNHYHGQVTPIGLTQSERQRHLYIIGGTGNGKTTMLFYGILQDIRAGQGVAVLDPHGDLAERILRYIPAERIKDVIYLNPDDLSNPIGLNLLELPAGLTGDDLLREKDLVTEATISVIRKIFSDDDSGGHRIEYILRNTIQTALTLEGSTLFTIFKLLNDAKFRRQVVKGLEDENLKDFWLNEIGKAGEYQRVKMAAGITAKIGRFLFSASAKRILEQPKSTIDFDDILASRKILICNVSKGLLGEDTSALFGTTVLAKLQTAALRRARLPDTNRTPYYLYVDEFQNFATISFVQLLSEARKYKLLLTMAEQSTSQQDQQRLVDIILANVGTIVCFRSGSPADERLVLPLFSPFLGAGEIANLPAYSYYVRIAAVQAQEPMSGVTIVVEDPGSEAVAARVIASSRELYATKPKSVEPVVLPNDAPEPKSKLKTKTSQASQPASQLANVKPLA